MEWFVWAAVAVTLLTAARAWFKSWLGRSELEDPGYRVGLAIGAMCLAAGLGIVVAAGSAVFGQ